jgi:hypothetical protein
VAVHSFQDAPPSSCFRSGVDADSLRVERRTFVRCPI